MLVNVEESVTPELRKKFRLGEFLAEKIITGIAFLSLTAIALTLAAGTAARAAPLHHGCYRVTRGSGGRGSRRAPGGHRVTKPTGLPDKLLSGALGAWRSDFAAAILARLALTESTYPTAAKILEVTDGATTQMVGSPTPPQKSSVGTSTAHAPGSSRWSELKRRRQHHAGRSEDRPP